MRIKMKKLFLLLLTIYIGNISIVRAEWSDTAILRAIYLAEGGSKAKVPYGILSIKVKNETEARQICLNTIRNNKRRYAQYGYKQYPDFLSFLASRYCPVKAHPLNKNWLKNVNFFLTKGEK